MELRPILEIFGQLINSPNQVFVIVTRLSEHGFQIFNFETFYVILILVFIHVVFQILDNSFVLNSLIEHSLLQILVHFGQFSELAL